MNGELKVNNRDSTPADATELERQNQWDAIAEEDPSAKYISTEEDRNKERLERREVYKNIVEKKRLELAKTYANNRRLFVREGEKDDFEKARNDYERSLDKYLRLDAEITYDARQEELGADLQAKLDELLEKGGDDIEAQEQALRELYAEDCKKAKNEINQNFLENFLAQQEELSNETIKEINGGNTFRKVVHAFRSNKYIKTAVIAAGVAGLAVATAGLAGVATGAVSVGFGLTAKGAALGAARGAATGLIFSRQDAKNSAINSFNNDNREEIIKQFEKLGDVTNPNADTRGVAHWLMAEYDNAATADRKDNRKRTAIATGLGAALGALSSGVQISKTTLTVENDKIAEIPDTIDVTSNLNKVNINEGGGAWNTFTQMGGDPDKFQQALDIMHSVDAKYGLVPGDSGVAGSFAHTYPGPISSWPDAAQAYIEEVAKEWAKQDLIEPTVVKGGPIYGPVFKATQTIIPTGFLHYLVGAATGTVVGDAKTSKSNQSEKQINDKDATEIKEQIDERDAIDAAEIEKLIKEREAKDATEIEKLIKEREAKDAAEIGKLIDERNAIDAAEIKNQIDAREPADHEFESKLRNKLARSGIDFLEDDDINLILTPTSATPVNTANIENLANRLTWKNKKALKDFFIQQKDRNLITTQFGEWIIENTPDEDPRETAKREQIW